MNSSKTRIVAIDDHPVLLDAIKARLEVDSEFEVVATAEDSDRGYYKVVEFLPDIVLLDIELPGRGAFTVAEEIAFRLPSTQVVFFTGFLTDVFLDQALRLNARGYFLKGDPIQTLISGLRHIRQGEQRFSETVLERLEFEPATNSYQVKSVSYLSTLTSRQIEVLRHLVRGESVKEVARSMILSERAIESHKYRIMQKLGIHDRVELTRYAIREGLALP